MLFFYQKEKFSTSFSFFVYNKNIFPTNIENIMNIYAMNLARKLQQITVEHNEAYFSNYISNMNNLIENNELIKEINNNLSFVNIFNKFIGFLLIGCIYALLALLGINMTDIELPPHFIKIMWISGAIGATILSLIKEPKKIQMSIDENQKHIDQWRQIIDEISNPENFQKILPVLKNNMDTEKLKLILVAASEGKFKSIHIEQIQRILQKYFVDNFNPDNFTTLQNVLNESQKQEVKNQHKIKESQENIQFFTQNS